ncbi:hypothetical protein [Selenomonas ruminantium]|uniref:hypothetical protein n=1 Tax=Selenomonas ruminantium TaxID=971 RepID=UPI0026EB6B4B|nr:hypothetical protein [Selenomonas ruminantium]
MRYSPLQRPLAAADRRDVRRFASMRMCEGRTWFLDVYEKARAEPDSPALLGLNCP